MNFDHSTPQTVTSTALTNAFLRSVYKWMGLGLAVTAVVSYIVIHSGTILYQLIQSPGLILGCVIAQLALVFYLSARISKLSAGTATSLFLLYSALNGVTLSLILVAYTASSVTQAFLTATGMFIAMSIYGSVTKRDLSSLGGYLIMGLFGVIIASIVNIFMRSSGLEFGISLVGVVLFLGLTAYDTQFLKEMGNSVPQDDELAVRRATILGALKLYLDFINLFLFLLRLMGRRR